MLKLKDLAARFDVSVVSKGLANAVFVSVDSKGVRGIGGLQSSGGNQLSAEEGSSSTSLSAGSRLLWSLRMSHRPFFNVIVA